MVVYGHVKEHVVRFLVKPFAVVVLAFLPSLLLSEEPAMVFGPASISLGLPKGKLVELCPIVSKMEEATAHALAKKTEESCSLIVLGGELSS